MSKDTAGPAFPVVETIEYGSGPVEHQHFGMTLLDWFAGKALDGLLAFELQHSGQHPMVNISDKMRAEKAYELARAMLAERAK